MGNGLRVSHTQPGSLAWESSLGVCVADELNCSSQQVATWLSANSKVLKQKCGLCHKHAHHLQIGLHTHHTQCSALPLHPQT